MLDDDVRQEMELQGMHWHPNMLLGDIMDPFTTRSSGTFSPITMGLVQVRCAASSIASDCSTYSRRSD